MKSSQLMEFFLGNLEPNDFQKLIETEVKNFKELLKKRGSSIPIYLDHDIIQKIFVDKNSLDLLLKCVREDILDKYYLSYIADLLLLSENVLFSNDKIKDELSLLTDFNL